MSSSIDERIVEMRFDNAQFEKGIKQSSESIEKLKKDLQFKDTDKGFKKLQETVKEVDLSQIESSLDTLTNKFSLWSVAAREAVKKVVNSVLDAGKKMVKSFTIDPVKTGWDKYGKKVSAIQQIVSATANDVGTLYKDSAEQMSSVTDEMEKLNWFTDETSYTFTDMVDNVGKFTSAGVGLEDASVAMQGIATWAASAGQNASGASHAMIQLSQALGSGSVKLMDWKSIENLTMGTVEFKQAAMDAAVAQGTLNKVFDTTKLPKLIKERFNCRIRLVDRLNEHSV